MRVRVFKFLVQVFYTTFLLGQRRQSFDLLLDNTKEIFQGISKSLERRNSESEVASAADFFSFGK